MAEIIGENGKIKIDKDGFKRDERGRFVEGTAPGPGRKRRDFLTDFKIAAEQVAKEMGIEDWEQIYVELLKKGIKNSFGGNYNFWKDIAERIYGKEIEKSIISGDEDGLPVVIKIVKDDRENNQATQ